jgi:hypothetical protein
MFLEPRPGFSFTGASVRAIAPPPPERRPDGRQVLADPVTGLIFGERPQGECDLAGPRRLLPRGGRPRPGGPVRRGDAPQPGTPVRPVDVFHPPLPVLPADRAARLVLRIFRHIAIATRAANALTGDIRPGGHRWPADHLAYSPVRVGGPQAGQSAARAELAEAQGRGRRLHTVRPVRACDADRLR